MKEKTTKVEVKINDSKPVETTSSEVTPETTDAAPEQGVDRVTELETALADKEKALLESRNEYLRAVAELDTVRRRKFIEAQEFRKYAAEQMLRELLPALLDLDRILSHRESATIESLSDALEMLRQKTHKAIANCGGEMIAPTIGAEFDPNIHEALGELPVNELPEHSVAALVETGWKLHDRLIRAAKVMLVAASSGTE